MPRLPRPRETRRRESTIALINIVFLMLIFFLLAGTLAPPVDSEVSLISTEDAERAEPPDALFVTRDGRLRARGRETSVAAFVDGWKTGSVEEPGGGMVAKLAADRDLPATTLIDIVGELRAAGVEKVSIVTERAVQ